MHTWIMEMMNTFGYIGIALLITIENIFPPIPSELILTFGGFMTTYTEMRIVGVIAASTLGSTIGAVVLYFTGMLLTPEKLERILDGQIGKILHFKKEDMANSMERFAAKGKITVFLCRCVPIVRSLISVPAGMSKMKFAPFLLLTAAGSTLWNTILVCAGAAAGASWEKVLKVMDTYSTLAILVIGMTVFLLGFFSFRNRSKQ